MPDYEFRKISNQLQTVGKAWQDAREVRKGDADSLTEVQEMGRTMSKAQKINPAEVVLVQLAKPGRSRMKGNAIIL